MGFICAIHLVKGKDKYVGGNPYDTFVRGSFKRFGAGTGSGGALLGGNNNDIDADPAILATIAADLIELNGGTNTGISIDITNIFDGWSHMDNNAASTANHPAPTYDRGFRLRKSTDGTAELTFSGFTAYANMRLKLAFDGTGGSFTTELVDITITDGDGTYTDTGFDTAGGEIETDFIEVQADSSGDLVITLDCADAAYGSNNGTNLAGFYLEYES